MSTEDAQPLEETELPTITKQLADALIVYITRLYAIHDYSRKFSKHVFLHDLEVELSALYRHLSILQSINDPEDENLPKDIADCIESIEDTRSSILELRGIASEEKYEKKLDYSHVSKFEVTIEDSKFHFDPSILPSSFSPFHRPEDLFIYEHFLKTQFIALITEFELLLSKIVRAYYSNFEGSLDQREVKFKIEDIKKFDNIADIRNFIIEGEVFKFTSGNLEDWSSFLKEKFSIDLKKVAPKWEVFTEYFSRRNLYIHNDGVVNDEYIRRNKGTEFSIGEDAEISVRYLRNSIEDFLIVGSTIIFMTWNHVSSKEMDKIREQLNDLGYHALINKHWRLSERLYTLLDMYGNDNDKLISKINKWLSLKNQGKFESVVKEVEAFDHLTYSSRFSAAVYGLLDDSIRVVDILPQTDIDLGELLEWPVFNGIRHSIEFNKYLKNILRNEAIQLIEVSKLESMSMHDLRKLAKSNGLQLPFKITRVEAIHLLNEHRRKQIDSERQNSTP